MMRLAATSRNTETLKSVFTAKGGDVAVGSRTGAAALSCHSALFPGADIAPPNEAAPYPRATFPATARTLPGEARKIAMADSRLTAIPTAKAMV